MQQYDLTGNPASNTYGRLVQTIDNKYYDGFGNLLNLTNVVGPQGITGPQGEMGMTGPEGLQGFQGPKGDGILGYYASFYSTDKQYNPTASSPNILTLNTTDYSSGITLVDSSKITFQHSGVYKIDYSINFEGSSIFIWFSKNGNYITASNRYSLLEKDLTAINTIIIDAEPNDYMEILWSSDSTEAFLTLVSLSTPISPSARVNVQQILNQGGIGPQGYQGDMGMRGANGYQGLHGSQGAQGVQGFQGIKGDGSVGYYASIYDTTAQSKTIEDNPPYLFTFNTIDKADGIHLVDNSKITFDNDGVFSINCIANFNVYNNSNDVINIWISKNGNFITASNIVSSSSKNESFISIKNNQIIGFKKDDYIEIYWNCDNINVFPDITVWTDVPLTPSIKVNIQQIVNQGAQGVQGPAVIPELSRYGVFYGDEIISNSGDPSRNYLLTFSYSGATNGVYLIDNYELRFENSGVYNINYYFNTYFKEILNLSIYKNDGITCSTTTYTPVSGDTPIINSIILTLDKNDSIYFSWNCSWNGAALFYSNRSVNIQQIRYFEKANNVGYFGNFYSTQTQLNPTPNFPNIVTLNLKDESNGTSIATDRLNFAYGGTYKLEYSLTFDSKETWGDKINVWFHKNGIYMSYSTAVYTTTTRLVATNHIITSVNAYDYISLYWSCSNPNVTLMATQSLNMFSPSVKLSVHQITYLQYGSTASGGGGGGVSSYGNLPVPKIRLGNSIDGIASLQYINNDGQVEGNFYLFNAPSVIVQDFTQEQLDNGNIFLEMVVYKRQSRKKIIDGYVKKVGYVVPNCWKPNDAWTLPWPENFWNRGNTTNMIDSNVILVNRPNHYAVTNNNQIINAYAYLNGRFKIDYVTYRQPGDGANANVEKLCMVPTNSKRNTSVPDGYGYSSNYMRMHIAFRYIYWDATANDGRGQIISGPLTPTLHIGGFSQPFYVSITASWEASAIAGRYIEVVTSNPEYDPLYLICSFK